MGVLMGTAILITSGKGGTGKTACCAAIASFLASSGHKTLCIDCDSALRNLDLALGLSCGVLYDFMDVLDGSTEISDAVTAHPAIENLWFLSAPADFPDESAGVMSFREMTDRLKEEYDYILMDSPAGIGSGFRLAAGAADMAIIVATGDLASLRDGQRTALELRKLGVTNLRLLINRVKPRAYRKLRRNLDDVIDTVGVRLIGVISEDESVSEAGNLETPLLLYGAKRAWGQFRAAAARVAGERVPLGKI